MSIVIRPIEPPAVGDLGAQPIIPGGTYEARCREAYRRAGCDWFVVYADREHFANMAFLCGFEPRFEEALLLLGPDDRRFLITGNECESYAALAGLPGLDVELSQTMSLMGQDRSRQPRLLNVLQKAGISPGKNLGLAGWKYLEAEEWDGDAPGFFVPAFFVDALRKAIGPSGKIIDATSCLMHPETGLRSVIDADQIAAFEWAAARSSQMLWRIVSGIHEGETEFEATARMEYQGDPFNVHTMFASGDRNVPVVGLRSPSGRRLRRGDGITAAIGFSGGLASRAGLITDVDDDFLKVASSYFAGLITWYETAAIGVAGDVIFTAVTDTLARAELKSALNPGHLTGHDEWVHSPIRPGSSDCIRSGMPFQVDVIPVPLPNGWALNCEDAVIFAEEPLRAEIRAHHPATWQRIESRQAFMRNILGVRISDAILPISSIPLCLPPFWLRPTFLLARD